MFMQIGKITESFSSYSAWVRRWCELDGAGWGEDVNDCELESVLMTVVWNYQSLMSAACLFVRVQFNQVRFRANQQESGSEGIRRELCSQATLRSEVSRNLKWVGLERNHFSCKRSWSLIHGDNGIRVVENKNYFIMTKKIFHIKNYPFYMRFNTLFWAERDKKFFCVCVCLCSGACSRQ
jgi:hypothetical protein